MPSAGRCPRIVVFAYALTARAASAISYGLLIGAFLWQLFAAVLGAPSWLIDLSPFVHLGLSPARPFRPGTAAVIALIGVAAAAIGCRLFERRDPALGD